MPHSKKSKTPIENWQKNTIPTLRATKTAKNVFRKSRKPMLFYQIQTRGKSIIITATVLIGTLFIVMISLIPPVRSMNTAVPAATEIAAVAEVMAKPAAMFTTLIRNLIFLNMLSALLSTWKWKKLFRQSQKKLL